MSSPHYLMSFFYFHLGRLPSKWTKIFGLSSIQAKPNSSITNRTQLHQTKLIHTKPNSTTPNQTHPNQTKQSQTIPNPNWLGMHGKTISSSGLLLAILSTLVILHNRELVTFVFQGLAERSSASQKLCQSRSISQKRFLFVFYSVLMKSNLQVFRLWHNFYAQSWILYLNFGHEKLVSNWKNNQVMTLFPRDINIDQMVVRSLFGCLFVYVTQENAYNLLIFSARKMFLYFFLHRIQWGIQWYHQILSFTTVLLRKRTKANCNMLQNFEYFLKTKSLISYLF